MNISSTETTTTTTIVTVVHKVKVQFPDPLFPDKKVKWSKKIKIVNGQVVTNLESDLTWCLGRHYNKLIGECWKTYDVSDKAKNFQPRLPESERAARRIQVNERIEKVRKASREVAKEIRKHIGIPET